jgi:excisionase family DNA binding protein
MEHNIKNEKETPKWLRSKHVREMLKVSDSTLQTLRINGSIPAYRLGASWFYKEDEILQALEKGKINSER